MSSTFWAPELRRFLIPAAGESTEQDRFAVDVDAISLSLCAPCESDPHPVEIDLSHSKWLYVSRQVMADRVPLLEEERDFLLKEKENLVGRLGGLEARQRMLYEREEEAGNRGAVPCRAVPCRPLLCFCVYARVEVACLFLLLEALRIKR